MRDDSSYVTKRMDLSLKKELGVTVAVANTSVTQSFSPRLSSSCDHSSDCTNMESPGFIQEFGCIWALSEHHFR